MTYTQISLAEGSVQVIMTLILSLIYKSAVERAEQRRPELQKHAMNGSRYIKNSCALSAVLLYMVASQHISVAAPERQRSIYKQRHGFRELTQNKTLHMYIKNDKTNYFCCRHTCQTLKNFCHLLLTSS